MGSGSSSANEIISNNMPLYPVQQYYQKETYPQSYAMPIHQMPHSAPNTNSILISEEHLEDYVNLEKEIHALEKTKVLQTLHHHVDQLQCLIGEITKLEERKIQIESEIKTKNFGGRPTEPVAKQLLKDTDENHNKSTEPNAQQLIKEIDEIDKKEHTNKNSTELKKKVPIKESETDKSKKLPPNDKNESAKVKPGPQQVSDSLEKQRENIIAELNLKRKKYEEIEKEIAVLNEKAADLLDKYLKQDELLVAIFGEGFATEEEARLSSKLSRLEDKKERIENARRKWKEAQLLLEYACKQLAVAVQQWQDLPRVPTINLEVRYSLNDMPQGNGNNGQYPLPNNNDFKNLPQCTPQEIAALEAMASSSAPGTIDERYLVALDNYSDCHKQAIAMLKWFNKVLNTTIHRDLVDVSEEVRFTSQALRKERIQFMNGKLKEKYGKSFDLDYENFDDENVHKLLMGCDGNEKSCPIKIPKVPKSPSEKTGGNKTKAIMKPAVNIQQVDGNLQTLKQEREKEIKKVEEGLKANRARIEQQLGQQLSARRDLRAQRSPTRVAES